MSSLKQINWFDRKFDFSFKQNIFPTIMERLAGTPVLLRHKVGILQDHISTHKFDNGWSIREHVGHLIDLEPLWQKRLEDILNKKELLREADLENKQTDLANHNAKKLDYLLEEFSEVRKMTLDKLSTLTESEIYDTALHPRLKKPMRTMDLFLFVAEHDDHHLVKITELMAQDY